MNASGRRAARYLDYLPKVSTLTEDGKNWLIAALDPFHDLDISPRGYPDINLSPCVMQLVKQTVQFSCPSDITSGTWDLSLFSLPWWTVDSFCNLPITNNVIDTSTAGSATQYSLGGVTAIACPTGTVSWDPTNGPSGSGITTTAIGLNDSYFAGASRVVAAGFEAVNTTSKLYKQGQVIVYRQPQPVPTGTAFMHASDGSSGYVVTGGGSYCRMSPPPGSPQQAMLLIGSRQWEASEGAYCVVTFNSLDLPADGDEWVDPVIQPSEDQGNVPSKGFVPNPYIAGAWNSAPQLMSMSPQNMSGMYFTGLSLQTTIAITLNVYVERFPSLDETDLVVLAKPSPAYDVFAQQLYTHALRDMPPGVPQYENGIGDWFAGVVSKVGSVVSKLTGSIPHPIAQAVSAGTGAASAVADAFIAPPNARLPAKQQRKLEETREAAQEAEEMYWLDPSSVSTHQKQSARLPASSRDRIQDKRLAKLDRRTEALAQQLSALGRKAKARRR